MKRISTSRPLRPLGALLGLILAVVAQGGTDPDTAEIMRHKLLDSQLILRGIALQDFTQIRTNAEQLVKLSRFSGWYTRQTPEYELFTVEFRRHADDLVKAAKNENIDAATLAYTRLTSSCVSCHRYMRGGAAQKVSLPLTRP
ncbi:MAG TPA: hypothetical protein VMB21_08130 [Candidatus Limnocylindria bacterium]|jgi:hypothetical protein|nr:hypothetical protein [Candidatus Limnocylindria bacterium]